MIAQNYVQRKPLWLSSERFLSWKESIHLGPGFEPGMNAILGRFLL